MKKGCAGDGSPTLPLYTLSLVPLFLFALLFSIKHVSMRQQTQLVVEVIVQRGPDAIQTFGWAALPVHPAMSAVRLGER